MGRPVRSPPTFDVGGDADVTALAQYGDLRIDPSDENRFFAEQSLSGGLTGCRVQ
jgi:hypothetical protein